MKKYLVLFFVEVLWLFRMPSLFAQEVISAPVLFPGIAAIEDGVLTRMLLRSSIFRQFGTDFSRFSFPLSTDPARLSGEPVWGADQPPVDTGHIASETIKALLIPDDLPDWRQYELHGQWQQVENNPMTISIRGSGPGPEYRIYLSIIDQQFRVVMLPTALTDRPRTVPVDLIPGLLLQIYYLLLTGSEASDLIHEAMAIAAAGSGGDDGQPPDHHYDKPVPYILYGYPELQPLLYSFRHLVSQSAWLKHRLLEILHQRIRQAILSGNNQLARVLRDRVIVIEADREALLRLATIDITHPDSQWDNRDIILPLLQTWLADALEVSQYDRLPVGEIPDKHVKSAGTGASKQTAEPARGNTSAGAGRISGTGAHRSTQESPERARGGGSGDGEEGADSPPEKKQTPRNNGAKLDEFPSELLVVISEYLGFRDGLALALTCRRLYDWFRDLPADLFFSGQVGCYFSPAEARKVKEQPWSEATMARRQHTLQTLRVPGYIIEKNLKHPFYSLVLLRFLSEIGKVSPKLSLELEGQSGCTVACVSDECVACVSDDFVVRLWNTRTGACVRELQERTDAMIFLGMYTDTLLVAASIVYINIWNIITGECLQRLQLGSSSNRYFITCMTPLVYPRLAAGYEDKSIRVWNTETQTCMNLQDPGVIWSAKGLAALDRNRLASAHECHLFIWDLSTGVVTNNFDAKSNWIICLKRMGGNRLASGSCDRTIKIWNTDTWDCVVTLEDDLPVFSIDLLWDNRLVSVSGSVKFWNPRTRQRLPVLPEHKEHKGPNRGMVATFDDCLACISGGTLCVWQLYPSED